MQKQNTRLNSNFVLNGLKQLSIVTVTQSWNPKWFVIIHYVKLEFFFFLSCKGKKKNHAW
jgi:hypothetical protein